nr:site-specific integrase [Jatrophihabitans sp. GAS493]
MTVGVKGDGSPDRRHVRAQSEAEIIKKVRKLERDRESGSVVRAGEKWTVEQWLEHWLENIAGPFVRPNTLSGYRAAVRVHLVPGIGKHKLVTLRPEHLELMYVAMLKRKTPAGTLTKPATVHHAHRTLRAALNEAVKRGYLASNPALLARAPVGDDDEVVPYSVEEVQTILRAGLALRNGARWAVALALGLRQGEALALKWADVDFESGTLTVRRNRLRPRFEHGCGAASCGKAQAGYCPQRVQIRPDADETKSRAGKRLVGLPNSLVELLVLHRSAQDLERRRAAQLWQEDDWVFTDVLGRPVNPRTDWSNWKDLLSRAGVRDGRLHDARHTAATVLLLLGVPERAVMGVMGWSDSGMVSRYAHIVAPIRRDIADRVGGLIWDELPGRAKESGTK